MNRMLQLDPDLLAASTAKGRIEQGVYSFIARHPDIQAYLCDLYGREGLCLKVFKQPIRGKEGTDTYRWGKGVLVVDSAKAQNLFARYGLAPRVYDVVVVNDCYVAQVTDYAQDDGKPFDRPKAIQVVREHGVRSVTGDGNPVNWVGSQMVDFQFHFLPPEYPEMLIERAQKFAAWGSRSEPYQALFDEDGQRDTAQRIDVMRLDEIEYEGKSVLDIGCNLGEFCRDAASRGARRIVGVDLPRIAELAYDLSNWLGHWSIDFIGAHLPRERDKVIGGFDVVYALSCKQCQPYPWLFEHCDDILFIEGHVAEKEHHYRPMLEEPFSEVETLGATKDHGPRLVLRCKR